MEWFTSEPPIDTPILCKFQHIDKSIPDFYVCQRENYHINRLTEACGEQSFWWEMEELIAWTTLEELEKDFRNCYSKKIFLK